MWFSKRRERKDGKTEQETWGENAGESGNEKAFEMLSDIWGEVVSSSALHSSLLLIWQWVIGSTALVCLVPCSSYQLAARVPSRSTWFTRLSDRGSSLATVLRALEVTIEDNMRYFDLFVNRMWADDMACDSSVLRALKQFKMPFCTFLLFICHTGLYNLPFYTCINAYNSNIIFWY